MIICGPNYRGCKNNCVNAHCGGLKLTKMTVEAALNAEMDYFLDKEEGNSRNGYNRKQLKGDHGQFELNTPRGRQSKFEPQLFKKRQTRITGMDDQIMALYAKGMSTRDIVDIFEEMYGVDISPALVSQVTNSVMERIVEWQSRPLEPLCPIVYLDCIVVKIRQDKRVINKAVYLAIQSVSRKWTMPIRNWKVAMNRFIIEFEEQLAPYI